MRRTISLSILILTLAGTVVSAGIPSGISYQGRVTDASGMSVPDSTYSLKFALYDAPTGGTLLWESGYRPVVVTDGLFTYVLGSDVPFPSNLFADSSRWLGTTVEGSTEMTPRLQMLGSAYAHRSLVADSAGTVHWDNVQGIPTDIGDAVTEVIAGSGLAGGGGGGSVTLSVPTGGINSGHIAPFAVATSDIATGAITSALILDNSIAPEDLGSEAGAVGSFQSFIALPDWAGNFTGDVVIDSVVINAPTSGVALLVAGGWLALQHTSGADESFARVSVGTSDVGTIINLDNFTSFSVPGAATSGTYRVPFSLVTLEPIGAGRQVFYLRGARKTGALCDAGDVHFEAIFLPTTYGPVEQAPSPKTPQQQTLDPFGEPVIR